MKKLGLPTEHLYQALFDTPFEASASTSAVAPPPRVEEDEMCPDSNTSETFPDSTEDVEETSTPAEEDSSSEPVATVLTTTVTTGMTTGRQTLGTRRRRRTSSRTQRTQVCLFIL